MAPVWVPDSPFTFWQGPYVQVGGGGEAGLTRWFGIGGEAGGLISQQVRPGRSAAVLSFNGYLHPASGGKLDAFATAGPSLLAGRGAGFMINFGGGANYWFHERIGLRVEPRDHAWSPESGSTVHFVALRFGLSFRR